MTESDDKISGEVDVHDLSSYPETETPLSIHLTRDENERSKDIPNSDNEVVPLGMVPPLPVAIMTTVNWLRRSHPNLNQFGWENDTMDFPMPSCSLSTSAGGWNPVPNSPGSQQLAPDIILPATLENDCSYQKSAYGFANSEYLCLCKDREIMNSYLPFHQPRLMDPELSVSAAYDDEYQGPSAHKDDCISLNHTSGREHMTGLPNSSGQARSDPPPRVILEIFRAEKGWRPAPEAMLTTWKFGAVGERLMPAMLSNPISTDGYECL